MKSIALVCDRNWNVLKILHDSFGTSVRAGDDFKTFVSPGQAKELDGNRTIEAYRQFMTTLDIKGAPAGAAAFVTAYHEHFIVVAASVSSSADFSKLPGVLSKWSEWGEKNLPLAYQDGYYRIQRMNNRLINVERALTKRNQQLERALSDARDAHDVISLLEHDKLTGLYTSNAFFRAAKRLTEKNPGQRFDAVVFELDGFRQVVEIFGRKAGDDLLRNLSLFVIGLPCSDRAVFARADMSVFFALAPTDCMFAEELHTQVTDYLSTYPLSMHLQVSVGVCKGYVPEIAADESFNRARMAFDSLGANTGGIAYYDDDLLSQVMRRHQILEGVDAALEDGDFRLYLQSKVDMSTRKVVGAEALVRWEHPELGFLAPADFVPLLEQRDRIYEVDQYIWREACRMQRARKDAGLPLLPISVNVSRGDFYKDDLVDVLVGMLEHYGLSPEAIRIEVIERAYARDSERLPKVLAKLRRAGFVVEIDDFGTGESSLSMLADMPADVLKLDRGFVIDSCGNERRLRVVDSIIQLAEELDMQVIAEGVETVQQEQLLLSLGCRFAQGYLYCKPQPAVYFLGIQ